MHAWSIPVAIIGGIVAIVLAPGVVPKILAGIYGLGLTSMFAFSALFHRVRWTDDSWWRMRQLDHTGIYLVIAGSFTGIAGLSLQGTSRIVLLSVVWVTALAGIAYRWLPVVPPFGLMTALYVVLAGMFVPFSPQLADSLGPTGLGFVIGGCIIYFFGALALGARVPDISPKVFGYHEVWHVVVVVCSVLHYIAVVGYAIPAARDIAEAAAAAA